MKTKKNKLSNISCTRSDRLGSQQGFTLLETVISMVIMLIVGLGAASLFTYSITNNSSGRDRQLSSAVAQQQIESLRKASYATLSTTVANTGGSPKTVTSAGRSYRVTTTIADTTASLKTVTVSVTPLGAGQAWATQNFGGVTIVTQRAISSLGPNR
jgi:prepilin-type N-terminal cleavage/methylation domain-containing protein